MKELCFLVAITMEIDMLNVQHVYKVRVDRTVKNKDSQINQ
jgi:hypothetical protein